MSTHDQTTDPLPKLATGYFDYLAKCFPVMCASDEFHFLPRAQAASRYYDKVENLDAEDLEKGILATDSHRHTQTFCSADTAEQKQPSANADLFVCVSLCESVAK